MDIYASFLSQLNPVISGLCGELYDDSDAELRDMYLYATRPGRRYRPMLFLTGKVTGDSSFDDNSLVLASVLEIIHKYSLILDDVVDNDPLRRGEKTFHQKFGKNNAQAMSAYLMNLLFRQMNLVRKLYTDDSRINSILSLYEEILSDMSVGFISDLNKKSRDVRGVRKISDMQTSTLLRNALLIGFVSSDYYLSNECAYLYKTLCRLGDDIGTVFQAYNDIEVFLGEQFQMANKGHLFPDFMDNRKNIILSRVPMKVVSNRDTSELIDYINKNHLFDEVFSEIFDVLKDIHFCISVLPESIGKFFLAKFHAEKEKVINDLSKEEIFHYNNIKKISAI